MDVGCFFVDLLEKDSQDSKTSSNVNFQLSKFAPERGVINFVRFPVSPFTFQFFSTARTTAPAGQQHAIMCMAAS